MYYFIDESFRLHFTYNRNSVCHNLSVVTNFKSLSLSSLFEILQMAIVFSSLLNYDVTLVFQFQPQHWNWDLQEHKHQCTQMARTSLYLKNDRIAHNRHYWYNRHLHNLGKSKVQSYMSLIYFFTISPFYKMIT